MKVRSYVSGAIVSIALLLAGCAHDIQSLNQNLQKFQKDLKLSYSNRKSNGSVSGSSGPYETPDQLLITQHQYAAQYLWPERRMNPKLLSKGSYDYVKTTCEAVGGRLPTMGEFETWFGDYDHNRPVELSRLDNVSYWLADSDRKRRGYIMKASIGKKVPRYASAADNARVSLKNVNTSVSFSSANPNGFNNAMNDLLCVVDDYSIKGVEWMEANKDVVAQTLKGDNAIYQSRERARATDLKVHGLNNYYKALRHCEKQGGRLPLRSELVNAYRDGSVSFPDQKYISFEGMIVDFANIDNHSVRMKSIPKGAYVRCVSDEKSRANIDL